MLIFWILFAISFCLSMYALPLSIPKIRKSGYLVKDMYKPDKLEIPTNAGMIVYFTIFLSISIFPLVMRILEFSFDLETNLINLSNTHLALLLVVSIYSFSGLVDDLLNINRRLKAIVPVAFGYPLISVIRPESIWIPFLGDYDLGYTLFSGITYSDLFRVIIIPVYVMVVSNLVNMNSGYNGQQSGLSIIILSTLVIKSWIDGELMEIMPIAAFLGSMLGFWWFNKYPAKVLEGNIGSMLFGSVIGCTIVVQEYWWFGFFILIPHTFNYLLWISWIIIMKRIPSKWNPDKYFAKSGSHQKFGFVDDSGYIVVPNRLTLKWIPNYYWKLTEKHSTWIIYGLSTSFCIMGLFVF